MAKTSLPELEKFISDMDVENGTDLIDIEIIDGATITKKFIMRKYALVLQTVGVMIGIQVKIL